MSTFEVRRYCKYSAVIILPWMVSILLAETAYRILGDKPSRDLGGLYTPFGMGSYKLAPSVDTTAFWSAGHFSVHTDLLGLRCDEARKFAAKPGAQIDTLFLGDSQGFGNGVSFEDSLAGATAVLAGTHGCRVSNSSVGGHTLLNQFELARWLHDQQGLKVKNYVFLLTPVMLRNAEGFNRAIVGKDGRLYDKPVGSREQVTLWIKRHAVIYSRVRDAIRNCGIGIAPDAGTPFVFQIYGAGEAEKEITTRLLTTMERIKNFASAQGAKLHFIYVPLTVEVDSKSLKTVAARRSLKLDLDMPFRICAEVARQLDVSVYNLRPVLEKLQGEGHMLNLKGDFHYNVELSKACALSLWPNLETTMKYNETALINR